ncbi:WXG100 family type VII secretion target [Bacillus albus]|uniref:WXG100 family type VII secretion target n=1 Tax=Bacillus albus TaxID=2026189 RepID=UPI001419CCAF|nr:WXG100 family type VII secretion target [Bacillus albus]
MVQIKVTPEMLEEVANRASNTRIALESIHNNLCNEIDYLCSQWIGASNQQFVQMFNDARPKAFTSINSIIQVEEDLKRIAEKFRNTDNQDVTMEEGAMCGKPSSEEKGFDGGKLARDIAGEISGEYDVRRVWDGIDPSTGEKLSGWERAGAGVMAVAGLTPFGKIAKVGKGVKMTAKATEAVNTAKKVPVGGANVVKGTDKDVAKKVIAKDGSVTIKGEGDITEVIDNRPYLEPKNRPSFRKKVPEITFENAKGPDGLVRDPLYPEKIIEWKPGQPRKNVWDMGHLPEHKYSDIHKRYLNGELTPKEFRDWFNNPDNYRPELPSTNRSHKLE